jgi:hypothetical protein
MKERRLSGVRRARSSGTASCDPIRVLLVSDTHVFVDRPRADEGRVPFLPPPGRRVPGGGSRDGRVLRWRLVVGGGAVSIAVHVVVYGLLAGASALAATSVLVVLRTSRRRANGAAFAIGFVAAQLLLILLILQVDLGAAPDHEHGHPILLATLDLLVAAALVIAARLVRHPRPRSVSPRSHPDLVLMRDRVVARLGNLRPGATLGVGALLGVGGPKRITITLLAGATIAAGALSRTTEYSFAAVYAGIATVLVWLPVVLTLAFGSRAAEWTSAAQSWWRSHQASAVSTILVVVGAYFAVTGIVLLARH